MQILIRCKQCGQQFGQIHASATKRGIIFTCYCNLCGGPVTGILTYTRAKALDLNKQTLVEGKLQRRVQ